MVFCEKIDIPNQEMDPSGFYLLIKVDFHDRTIGVKICDKDHHDIETFWGRQVQDVYCSVLADPRSGVWFQDTTHIAYLGKELKKAEIALATGGNYYQE